MFLLQDQTAAHYIVIQLPVSEFEQPYAVWLVLNDQVASTPFLLNNKYPDSR